MAKKKTAKKKTTKKKVAKGERKAPSKKKTAKTIRNKQISNQPFAAEGVASFDAEIVENEAEGRIGIIQLSDLQFGDKHEFGRPSTISSS